jgi:hypothetical protein
MISESRPFIYKLQLDFSDPSIIRKSAGTKRRPENADWENADQKTQTSYNV